MEVLKYMAYVEYNKSMAGDKSVWVDGIQIW